MYWEDPDTQRLSKGKWYCKGLYEGTRAVMAKDEERQQTKLMRAEQSTEALKKPLALCLV